MSTPVDAATDRAVSAPTDRRWGSPPGGQETRSRLQAPSRRSFPHLALGALLVVACATGAAVLVSGLDERVPVLALARPVTVGQPLEPADLQEVSISADPGLAVVPATEAASVVGSTMAVSLPAGSLLTPAALGEPTMPNPNEAVVSVALAPGQFPPEVSPGARVLVVPVPDGPEQTPDEPVAGWAATVVGLHPTATEATTVVSLQLGEEDAGGLAATGQVRVVMVTPEGGE